MTIVRMVSYVMVIFQNQKTSFNVGFLHSPFKEIQKLFFFQKLFYFMTISAMKGKLFFCQGHPGSAAD